MSETSTLPYFVRMPDGNIIKLEYHKSLPSVSALAKEYANSGYPDRYVVFAETETGAAGEGEKPAGIYMSCILRPSIFPSQAVFVGPTAAVSAALALEEHTVKKVGVGWVSEIFCDGERIGSISVEGKLDNFTSYEYLIVNFSIVLGARAFPPRLTDMIRKVFESENTSIPMIIAKNILQKFFPLYINIKTPQKTMNMYKSLFALRGERAKCVLGGVKRHCKILGVDGATCSLIVEAGGGKIEHITKPAGVIIPKKLKKK